MRQAKGIAVLAAVMSAVAPAMYAPHTGGGAVRAATLNGLAPAEAAEGWILLFDGETTFGWKTEGDVRAKDGTLIAGGEKPSRLATNMQFGDFELHLDARGSDGVALVVNGEPYDVPKAREESWAAVRIRVESRGESHRFEMATHGADPRHVNRPGASRTSVEFRVPAGQTLALRNVRLRPLGTEPLFNGRDLEGWKEVPGRRSKFSVTDAGELNVKDGGGDLQTEGQWADFILQLDVISYGQHLNSGVFFRALPGKFWQGYEAQIRNQWEGDDRTRPVDYGTGGVYNHQPARKVVSSDHEWFTMTVAAAGPQIAVWVDGYQTADWTDTREPAESARNGKRLGKGCISLQGHDPATHLSFRNIRLAELPEAPGQAPD